MQYLKAYKFFFSKNNGWMNVLLCCVLMFIPIIGPIVLLGYLAEIADELYRDPDESYYVDFDFNRFVEYLQRGIWPFLAVLSVTLVFTIGLVFVVSAGFGIWSLTRNVVAGFAVGLALFVPLMFLAMLFTWTVGFHAKICRTFSPGEAFRFSMSMLNLVGLNMVLAILVSGIIGFWASALIVPCTLAIGAYPLNVILQAGQTHLMVQLYKLYLERGGAPINAKREDVEEDY